MISSYIEDGLADASGKMASTAHNALQMAKDEIVKLRLHASLYLWLRDVGSKTCSPLTERWMMRGPECDAAIIREMERQANDPR